MKRDGVTISAQLALVSWIAWRFDYAINAEQIYQQARIIFPLIGRDTVEDHVATLNKYLTAPPLTDTVRDEPNGKRKLSRELREELDYLALKSTFSIASGRRSHYQEQLADVLTELQHLRPSDQAEYLLLLAQRQRTCDLSLYFRLLQQAEDLIAANNVDANVKTKLTEMLSDEPDVFMFAWATILPITVVNESNPHYQYRLRFGMSKQRNYRQPELYADGEVPSFGQIDPVDVRISAPAFQVFDEATGEERTADRLELIQDWGTIPAEYELIALTAGTQTVAIDFYLHHRWYCGVELDINVPSQPGNAILELPRSDKETAASLDWLSESGYDRAISPVPNPAAIVPVAILRDPALLHMTIRIHHVSKEGSKVDSEGHTGEHFDIQVVADAHEMPAERLRLPKRRIDRTVNILQEELKNAIDQVECTSLLDQSAVFKTAEAGFRLFQQVFGDGDIARCVRDLTSQETLSIEIASDSDYFPWELLCSNPPNTHSPGDGFWGLRHHIYRVVTRQSTGKYLPAAIKVGKRPSIGFLYNSRLKHVMDMELRHLQLMNGAERISLAHFPHSNLHRSDLLDALHSTLSKEYHVVEFACHARYDAEDEDNSCFILADDWPVSLWMLHVRDTRLQGGPIVFLNACQTGSKSPQFDLGFANHFLGFGARAVLSTQLDVTDSFAADFAIFIHHKLLEGETLGTALLSARKFFWETRSNLTGLAYTLLGSPNVRVRLNIRQ